MSDMWTYRGGLIEHEADLAGYSVEATDGEIGTVDEASYDVGEGSIVVDTGFWIFGKKRMIPAGVIDSINHRDRKVRVAMTKEQIKGAPDFDAARRRADDYRGDLQSWYGQF
jgi:hypothetical protein